MDAAEEVCVYAKLPRTFQIPTPVGNYSPDWAIAFYEGKVKHIFFVAETKGTMEVGERDQQNVTPVGMSVYYRNTFTIYVGNAACQDI